MSSGLIDPIADWLMTQALGEATMEQLVEGCCRRLWAAGIPLQRGYVAYRTLHPLFTGVGHIWRRDEELETRRYQREQRSRTFDKSPHGVMLKTGTPFLRRRLTGPNAVLDFPVVTELCDEGATDYLAFIGPFVEDGADGIIGSWTTDRQTGFSDDDIKALMRIQRRLAVACKVTIKDQTARNVLAAYLGAKASAEVLSGTIKRGDGRTMHTVLWYSDLRDSTRISETMAADAFFDLLNAYFECTAGAVLAEGGQVTLLIGDAVLGIFPVDGRDLDEPAACAAAFAAARRATERFAELNQRREAKGLEPLGFGLGLHVGDVKYGNIGVPERLQFDVIGAAVNEVVRLEGLTKSLGRHVLATAEFAQCLPVAWDSLGQHRLRGVGSLREIFALPAEVDIAA